MSRSPNPDTPPPNGESFTLAWLRCTNRLADPDTRAQSLCDEAARRVPADRVSFLTTQASTATLIATSTTTTIDRRSAEAAWLRELAEEVCRRGTDFCTDQHPIDCPAPSLGTSQTLAIPIRCNDSGDEVDAVIVLQQYTQQHQPLTALWDDVHLEIAAAAQDVAATLRSRAARSPRAGTAWWQQATRWQRLALIASFCLALLLLLNVPITFRLPVQGQLEPAHSWGIFAPAAGTLLRLHVEDGQRVTSGYVLAELSNVDIELQQERLSGELAAAETELASLRLRQSERATPGAANPSPANRSIDTSSARARQMVLRARIDSLQQQNDLLYEVSQSLTIRAPVDGRVVLRDQQSDLVGQTVSQSQWLMRIVDPAGGYHAIIDLPEKDDAYLRQALGTDPGTVIGSFRLLASPDVHFSGQVADVADSVQWNERGKAAIQVTVPIDGSLPDDVHVGATVAGTMDVGQRSLGFVWFRPIIEFFRSYGW
ncbi:efflux RND transporter periplasmic adaptor subunit [Allorhodopirellula solitaria]|uniref:Multidrug efflux system subunit MdtA n=1 Tax=Allorhodopirellula solitaria TaxID=2527987 RepID=A0A5C5XXM7_9BACT|nr:HlyD family secretion protein [Allorhodopirellula solitaria]TWT66645.1 multidrug efflux system subunit MdtA [Allorhodopirellula solitaria]